MMLQAAMPYVWAFVIGGAICVLAQLFLDLAKINPAHVMVTFVCLGAIISGLGLYQPLIDLAGAGATVPLPGFGHALYQGIAKEVALAGPIGLLTGGLKATSLALTVAILAGVVIAVIFNPKG